MIFLLLELNVVDRLGDLLLQIRFLRRVSEVSQQG
jgi:hypothetical protein